MVTAPSADIIEYLTGCVAIYAACAGDGSTTIASAPNPWAQQDAIVHVVWVWGEQRAAAGVAAAQEALATGADVDGAFATIPRALWAVDHDRVLITAEHAVRAVNDQFNLMLDTGDMGPMNRAYRAARLAGEKLPPYPRFQAQYRSYMIRSAGRMAEARMRPGRAA